MICAMLYSRFLELIHLNWNFIPLHWNLQIPSLVPGTHHGLQFYLGVVPQTWTRWHGTHSCSFCLRYSLKHQPDVEENRDSPFSGLSDLVLVPGEHSGKGSFSLVRAVFLSEDCTRLDHKKWFRLNWFWVMFIHVGQRVSSEFQAITGPGLELYLDETMQQPVRAQPSDAAGLQHLRGAG